MEADRLILPRDATLHLEDAEGVGLEVAFGAVWITQEGDIRDIVVPRGERFVLDRGGRTLVTALREAQVTFLRRPPSKRSPRLAALARGFRASMGFLKGALQAAQARRSATQP